MTGHLSYVVRVILILLGAQSSPARIDLKSPSVSIGVLDGNPKEQFGELSAVAAQRGGRVAILDAKTGLLRVFDSLGTIVGEHGRLGSGPGEFRFPRAMVGIGWDTVAVLDHGLSRVSFFNTTVPARGYARSFKLDVPAWDFCGLGKWVFVSGYRARDSSVVRKLDLRGAELGAFGTPFTEIKNPIASGMVAVQTAIGCHPRTNLILVAHALYPVVRAYDAATGALKWTSTLSDFERTIIEVVEGGVRFSGPKSGVTDMVEKLLPLDSTLVLVQLVRYPDTRDALLHAKYEIRLLRADTGKEVGRQRGLHVLRAEEKMLFISDTTEYPRLISTGYSIHRAPR